MNKAKYLLLGLLLLSLVFAPAQEEDLFGGGDGGDSLLGGGADVEAEGGLFGGGDDNGGGDDLFGDGGGSDDGGGLFEGGDDSSEGGLLDDTTTTSDENTTVGSDEVEDSAADEESSETAAEDFEEQYNFTYKDIPVTPERRIIDLYYPQTVARAEVNILPGIDQEEFDGVDDVNFDIVEYHVEFGHMIEMSPNLYVSVGLKASIYDFSIDAVVGGVAEDITEALYAFDVPLALHVVATDQLMISLEVAPGLHSDLQGSFDARDLQVRGGIRISYAVNNVLALIAGADVLPDVSSYRVIPVAGFIWKPDPQFDIHVLLPYSAKAAFHVGKFNLSFIAFYESIFFEHFRIDDDNEFAGNDQDDDLNLYSMRAGLGVRYQFRKGCYLELLGGATLDGEIDLNKDDASDATLEGGSFFAKIGFTVDAQIFEN